MGMVPMGVKEKRMSSAVIRPRIARARTSGFFAVFSIFNYLLLLLRTEGGCSTVILPKTAEGTVGAAVPPPKGYRAPALLRFGHADYTTIYNKSKLFCRGPRARPTAGKSRGKPGGNPLQFLYK